MFFYLKQVMLALKCRKGKEEAGEDSLSAWREMLAAEGIQVLRADSCSKADRQTGPEHLGEKLAAEGIQVLRADNCLEADRQTMPGALREQTAEEKTMQGTIGEQTAEEKTMQGTIGEQTAAERSVSEHLGELDDPKNATLWITDDPDLARRMDAEGKAVLGYLPGDSLNTVFTDIRYLAMNLTELDGDYLDKVYRRYHGIPWDILETEHCLLRETTEEDVDAFYGIYAHPSVTAYMEDLFSDRDRELAYTRDYIKNIYELYGFGVWTVLLRETGEVIGRAGLSYREGFEDPELGFLIAVPWQGRGLATEVCRAILTFGKEELEFTKVIAFVMPENAVSCHLLQKLGFQEKEEVRLLGKRHLLWEYKG